LRTGKVDGKEDGKVTTSGVEVEGNRSVFGYERRGEAMRVRASGMSGEEMRMVLTGLWLAMTDEEREGYVGELSGYLATGEGEVGAGPPAASVEIGRAIKEAMALSGGGE
jgi:hypothetical protein